jgi:hypothetical protein
MTNTVPQAPWRVVLSAGFLMAAVGACGGNGEDGDAGSGGNNNLGVDPGIPSGSATACDGDDDCDAPAICHPIANVCASVGETCTASGSCPTGAYCDATVDACLSGLPGSPCASDANCSGTSTCTGDICACTGFELEQETVGGPLDIYFIFDRTASMGEDCDYEPGGSPPVESKACFATYALPDYLVGVEPAVDTRLAYQVMSYDDGCDGAPYATPMVDLTQLPVPIDHEIVTAISSETFEGGSGTQIEGALIGISQFTEAAETPGREMIGVLMTDGDPNGCNEDIDYLAGLIADHLAATGIRTFIIGMDGATESNLEELAIAGGAEAHDDFCGSLTPPCHYWNVGDGSGDAIASALTAIAGQAAPFPCEYALADIQPPDGATLDLSTLNVQLTQAGVSTVIANVASEDACPADEPAWYYDDNDAPTAILLCENACDLVTAAEEGATMNVVGGCDETVVLK